MDTKEIFNTYKITKNFELFNKAKKRFERLKLWIVRELLMGDGYENCITLKDYRNAHLALQTVLTDDEEYLVKRYVEKKWKKN